MVPCPPENVQGQMAFDVCDQIINLAMQAMPPTPESQECAAKAQQVKSATPPDPMMAANTLHQALQAAQAGDWFACKRELDQID